MLLQRGNRGMLFSLRNWKTFVLLHLGNGKQLCCYTGEEGKCCCFHLGIGEQLCCYTWEMEENYTVNYLVNEGKLYCYTWEMEDNCAVTLQKWRTIVLLHFRNGRQLCCYTSEMEDNCAFTLGKWRKIVQFTSRKKRETVFTHGNGRSHHHKVTMYKSEMAGQIMQFTPEKRRTSKMDRWENGGRNC